MRFLKRLLKAFIAGIIASIHAVFRYPRAAIPVIMIVLGYIWYQMPSTTPSDAEEKAWDEVLGHGKWKSYDDKVKAYEAEMERRIENARKPAETTPVPSGRKPLVLPEDGKITMQFDMGFSLMETQVYLRENPNSMKADFLVLCAPHNLAKLPMSPENQHLWRFYNKLIDDLKKDVASPSGWSYRAIRQRRWVVVFADPIKSNLYPNPSFDAVGSPPVGENDCYKQEGLNTGRYFSRNYFKLSGVP